MSAPKQKPTIVIKRRFVGAKPMKQIFQQLITTQVQRRLAQQNEQKEG